MTGRFFLCQPVKNALYLWYDMFVKIWCLPGTQTNDFTYNGGFSYDKKLYFF